MSAVPARPNAGWRERIVAAVESPRAERAIMALILVNAVTLGLETSATAMSHWGAALLLLDKIILAIFVLELTLRIVGHGARFFREPWNLFDFIVVSVAVAPAGADYAVLRALRVLRVLRLLSIVPQMRRVVSALLSAIPGLSAIILVLGLVFYVFAVMATNLFGGQFPQWFGNIGRSMYTLFQVMTLESWSMGIVRPVMEQFPYAWLFFVPFIMVATFTMLNLFIAIIVSAMQSQAADEAERTVAAVQASTEAVDRHVHAELDAIRRELAGLRAALEAGTVAQNQSRV